MKTTQRGFLRAARVVGPHTRAPGAGTRHHPALVLSHHDLVGGLRLVRAVHDDDMVVARLVPEKRPDATPKLGAHVCGCVLGCRKEGGRCD